MIAQYQKKGPVIDYKKQRLDKLISDSNKRRTRYQRDQTAIVSGSQTQEIVSPQYKAGAAAARMEHVSSTSQIMRSGQKMDAERPRQMSEMNDNTNE